MNRINIETLNNMTEAEVHEYNRRLARKIAIHMAVFVGGKIVIAVGISLLTRQLAKSLESNIPKED